MFDDLVAANREIDKLNAEIGRLRAQLVAEQEENDAQNESRMERAATQARELQQARQDAWRQRDEQLRRSWERQDAIKQLEHAQRTVNEYEGGRALRKLQDLA